MSDELPRKSVCEAGAPLRSPDRLSSRSRSPRSPSNNSVSSHLRRSHSAVSGFSAASRRSLVLEVEVEVAEESSTSLVGLTSREAVTTLIINCIGAGCVLFPAIMADMGMIFGPLLCVICAFTLQMAGSMVCSACVIAEELQGTKIATFEALARIAAPKLQFALVITKNFAMLARIITYMQLVVDSIASFLPGDEPLCKPVLSIRFFIVFPVFSFLAMITNLKQLARVATLGVSGAAALCACIALGGVAVMMKKMPDFPAYSLQPLHTSNADATVLEELLDTAGRMGKYLAVFLFTFAIIATVPSVRSQMAEPSQMPQVLSRTYTYIVIINCIVMFGGYLGFGNIAPENIISGDGGIAHEMPFIGIVATISLVVKIIVGTPLFTFVVIAALEASGEGAFRTPMTISNISLRVLLILVLNIIGMSLPYLMEGISLASSIFACFNNILYPALFHFIVLRRLRFGMSSQMVSQPPEKSSCLTVKYIAVAIMGLCLLVFGFKGSLKSVMEKIRKDAESTAVQC